MNSCSVKARGLSPHAAHLLLGGMPALRSDRNCGRVRRDSGPPAEVEAVREQMHGPLVERVVTVRDWALGDWYGAGGGETLFKKRGGHWVVVAGGGGALGVAQMRRYGVPAAAWCAFGIYDAKCP